MLDQDFRLMNILGAFCFSVTDKIHESANDILGMSASFPAALIQIGLFSNQLGNLQSALSLGQPACSRLVQRLETDGLVQKSRSTDDSRNRTLHLTPSGESQMRKVLDERYRVINGYVARLSIEDKEALLRIVSTILEENICDRQSSDSACRMCDVTSCPQDCCPAESYK